MAEHKSRTDFNTMNVVEHKTEDFSEQIFEDFLSSRLFSLSFLFYFFFLTF